MNEVFNSIAKWFKERTTSPLYGTFIFSVILWNWRFFYVLFWQSEDKLSLPRIEYVQLNFLQNESFSSHLLYFLIFPAISTYLIVRWLPIISNWAHKKHIEFYYDKRLIIDNARIAYETQEKDNLVSISVIKKEQAQVKKDIEQNTSKEDKWKEEFELLKPNPTFSRFKEITDIVYGNGGLTYKFINGQWVRMISPDILAFADTRGLIKINTTENRHQERIDLTEKGKFFATQVY